MIKENLLISKDLSIRDAIDRLVRGGKSTVFIVNKENLLLGLFTNGDMRKVLLSSTDFSLPIGTVMNSNPITFENIENAIEFSKTKKLVVYPIVDRGILTDAIFSDDDIFNQEMHYELADVPLIIMAGGKGTRLYPYTKILPKALIPIGEVTISERIINSFVKYGCKDVYLILNHKANMIKAYFNDLNVKYNIYFEIEKEFLGTAGGLSLLKNNVKKTFIVSNCDILVEDDLSCAFLTHKKNGNKITVVCSSKNFSIPYGVIKSDEYGNFINVEEKPQFNYLVNTGIYVIEPDVLNLITDNSVLNMPELLVMCAQKKMKVGIFPVSDKAWLDMGQFDNMNQMLQHFDEKHI